MATKKILKIHARGSSDNPQYWDKTHSFQSLESSKYLICDYNKWPKTLVFHENGQITIPSSPSTTAFWHLEYFLIAFSWIVSLDIQACCRLKFLTFRLSPHFYIETYLWGSKNVWVLPCIINRLITFVPRNVHKRK